MALRLQKKLRERPLINHVKRYAKSRVFGWISTVAKFYRAIAHKIYLRKWNRGNVWKARRFNFNVYAWPSIHSLYFIYAHVRKSKPSGRIPTVTWFLCACVKFTRENEMYWMEGCAKGDISRDDSQRRFLAQHSVATLLRHCFEWSQHCSNIAALCCAKNRRCESSRAPWP